MRKADDFKTVALCCGSLRLHLDAAQKKAGTDYQVIELDRRLHAEPKKMRQRIIETMKDLPEQVETVLVCMGFCGGSWENIQVKKRVVIPKVDDCITLLLHRDDAQHINLKKRWHIYFRDGDEGAFSIQGIKDGLCTKHGVEKGTSIFESWFANYTNADIIDTGVYDCHSDAYVKEAKKNADLIQCELAYVKGSNRILEKLVAGQWDDQFLVLTPGTRSKAQDFNG